MKPLFEKPRTRLKKYLVMHFCYNYPPMSVLVLHIDLVLFCLHYVCLYHSIKQHTHLIIAYHVSRLDNLSVLIIQRYMQ